MLNDVEKNRTIPIDARVVRFDETQYYHFDKGDKRHVSKVFSCYLYDKNAVTHCCELTPSYYMIWLYTTVVLTPKGEELDEYEKGELYQRYENEPTNDHYVHCRDIDAIEERAKPKLRPCGAGDSLSNGSDYYVYGGTGVSYDDTSEQEQMDSLTEHFRGNCPL